MRTHAILRNSLAGIVYQFSYIAFGFVSRHIFVRMLGIEYYGLNALFTSIMVFFSLVELGLSTVVSFHLYRPLSEGNQAEVADIMSLYHRMYRRISGATALLGLLFLPFVPRLIGNTLVGEPILFIFVLFVLESALSYTFACNRILLVADQKNYIDTIYEAIINSIVLLIRIGILYFTGSYILYLIFGIATRMLGNMLRSNFVIKRYPFLRDLNKVELNQSKKNQIVADIKSVFANKLSNTILLSSDNILITLLGGGISTVGLFSNYMLIFNIVNGLAGQLMNSYQASLGNLYAEEGKGRLFEIFRMTNFLCYWVASFCGTCLFVLSSPLISLWMGSAAVLQDYVIVAAVLRFCLTLLFDPINKVIQAAGLFSNDRKYVICYTCLNLALSIFLGYYLGISGIFWGGSIALLITSFLRLKYLCQRFFAFNHYTFIRKNVFYMFLITAMSGCAGILCHQISNWKSNVYVFFILSFIICIIVPNAVNCLLFRKTEEYFSIKNVVLRAGSLVIVAMRKKE